MKFVDLFLIKTLSRKEYFISVNTVIIKNRKVENLNNRFEYELFNKYRHLAVS